MSKAWQLVKAKSSTTTTGVVLKPLESRYIDSPKTKSIATMGISVISSHLESGQRKCAQPETPDRGERALTL